MNTLSPIEALKTQILSSFGILQSIHPMNRLFIWDQSEREIDIQKENFLFPNFSKEFSSDEKEFFQNNTDLCNLLTKYVKNITEHLCKMSVFFNKLIYKNNETIEFVQSLKQEINRLKELINERENDNTSSSSFLIPSIDYTEQLKNPKSLHEFNFNNAIYRYRIIFKNPPPSPLVKNHFFSMNIKLVDKNQEIVNTDEFPNIIYEVKLFDSSPSEELIQFNKKGKDILRGQMHCKLEKGEGKFRNLKITEVSSFYPNKIIQLMISPVLLNESKNNTQTAIFLQNIKPLVISNIVVKSKNESKKLNSKPQNDENDPEKTLNAKKTKKV